MGKNSIKDAKPHAATDQNLLNAGNMQADKSFHFADQFAYKFGKFGVGVGYSEMCAVIANGGAAGAARGLSFVPKVFTLVECLDQNMSASDTLYVLASETVVDEAVSYAGGKVLGRLCSLPFRYVTYGLDALELTAPYAREVMKPYEDYVLGMGKPEHFGEISFRSFSEMQMRRDVMESYQQGMMPILIGEGWGKFKDWISDGVSHAWDFTKEYTKRVAEEVPKLFCASGEAMTLPALIDESSQFNLPPEKPVLLYSMSQDKLPLYVATQTLFAPQFTAPFDPKFQAILVQHGFAPGSAFNIDMSMSSADFSIGIAPNDFEFGDLQNIPVRTSHAPIPVAPPMRHYGVTNPFSNISVSGSFNGSNSWSVVFEYAMPISVIGGWVSLGFTAALAGTLKFLEWRESRAYEKLSDGMKNTQGDFNKIIGDLNAGVRDVKKLLEQNNPDDMQKFIDSVDHFTRFIKGKKGDELTRRRAEVKKLGIDDADKKEYKKKYDELKNNCDEFVKAWECLKAAVGIQRAYRTGDENQAKQYVLKLPAEQHALAFKEVDQYFRFKENVAGLNTREQHFVNFIQGFKQSPEKQPAEIDQQTAAATQLLTDLRGALEKAKTISGMDSETVKSLIGKIDYVGQAIMALEGRQQAIDAFEAGNTRSTAQFNDISARLSVLATDSVNQFKASQTALGVEQSVPVAELQQLQAQQKALLQDVQSLLNFPGIADGQRELLLTSEKGLIKLRNNTDFLVALPKLLANEISLADHLAILERDLSPEERGSCYIFGGNYLLSSKQLEPARDLYQRALDLDTDNPEANLGMANVYASENLLDKALEQLKDFRDLYPDQITRFETHLSLQMATPIASFIASILGDYLHRQKDWTAKEHLLNVVLTLQQSHPQLLVSIIHSWFTEDPTAATVCSDAMLKPIKSIQNLDMRVSTMVGIQLIKGAERIPELKKALYQSGITLVADYLQDGFTYADLLTLEPYAIAHVCGMGISSLVRRGFFKDKCPETLTHVMAMDLTHMVPRVAANFWGKIAWPVQAINMVLGVAPLVYKYFSGAYHREVEHNYLYNTRRLLERGEGEQALVRYRKYPHFRNEGVFVERVLGKQELENTPAFSFDNKPDTVSAVLATTLICKTVLAGELEYCSAKTKNQYFSSLSQAVAQPVLPQDYTVALHQTKASVFQTAAIVMQSQGFANAGEEYSEQARIEATAGADQALAERRWDQQFTDWFKRQFNFGTQSTVESAKRVKELEFAEVKHSKFAAEFSAGDVGKGFGSHLHRVYLLRKQRHIREEMVEQEFDMVIKLSRIFADDIPFVDEKTKLELNIFKVVEYFLRCSLNDNNPALKALALYMLSKIKLQEQKQHQVALLNASADYAELPQSTVPVTQFLKDIQRQEAPQERMPVEVDLLDKVFKLTSENRALEQEIYATVAREFFIITPTEFLFRSFTEENDDVNKSLVEIFLLSLLAFQAMLKMFENLETYPQAKQYEAKLLDAMLKRGFLPPFKRYIIKYFTQECGLSLGQVQTLLDRFEFDNPTKWSAKKKFDLLTGLLAEAEFKEANVTLGKVNRAWGRLVRNALQCSRSMTQRLYEKMNENTPENLLVSELESLLKLGADPNFDGNRQVYLLHLAVQRGFVRVIELLCEYGAAVNVESSDGVTPLHLAAILHHEHPTTQLVEIEKILLQHGASRNLITQISFFKALRWWWNYGSQTAEQLLRGQINVAEGQLAVVALPANTLHATVLPRRTKRYLLEEHRIDLERTVSSMQATYDLSAITYLLENYAQPDSRNRHEVLFTPNLIGYFCQIAQAKEVATLAGKLLLTGWGDKFCVVYFIKDSEPQKAVLIHTDNKLPFPLEILNKLLPGVEFTEYKPATETVECHRTTWLIEMVKNAVVQQQPGVIQGPMESLAHIRFHKHLPCLQKRKIIDTEAEATAEPSVPPNTATAASSVPTTQAAAATGTKPAAVKKELKLIHIAKNNLYGLIRQALEEHADIAERDPEENATPLHWASLNGHIDVVEGLLAYNAPLEVTHNDGKGYFGSTPLLWAAAHGKTEVVKLLLQAGANPTAVNSRGLTPLSVAQSANHRPAAKYLLDQAFFLACEAGRYDEAIHLLAQGADIDSQDIREKDREKTGGHTALGAAIIGGHNVLVAELLKRNADVRKRNPRGNTPFVIAAIVGNKVAAEHLVARKVDINECGSQHRTATAWAAAEGKQNIVEYLIQLNADFTIADQEGKTPLQIAQNAKQQTCVDLLEKKLNSKLANGVWNNIPSEVLAALQGGVTPKLTFTEPPSQYVGYSLLFYALMNGYHEVASHLLRFGANLNEVITVGRRWWKDHYAIDDLDWTLATYVMYFYDYYPEDLILLVLDKGGDVNQLVLDWMREPRSLVTFMLEKEQLKIATWLLERGANPRLSNIPSRFVGLKTFDKLSDYYWDIYKVADETYWWILGNTHFYNQQYDQAIFCYKEVLEKNPISAYANFYIAKSLCLQNKEAEALPFLDKAIQMKNSAIEFFKLRAELHWKSQELQKALHDYQHLVAAEPTNSSYQNYLGCIYYRLNLYQEAAMCFSKALEHGGCAMHFHNRADALFKLDRYAEAANDYREAIRFNLNIAELAAGTMVPELAAHFADALHCKGLKKWDEALVALTHADEVAARCNFNNEKLAALRQELNQLKNGKIVKAKESMGTATPAAQSASTPQNHYAKIIPMLGPLVGQLETGVEVHFTREQNMGMNLQNPRPGSCGFISLGITRAQALDSLLRPTSLANIEARKRIRQQIRNDFYSQLGVRLSAENANQLVALHAMLSRSEQALTDLIGIHKLNLRRQGVLQPQEEIGLARLLEIFQQKPAELVPLQQADQAIKLAEKNIDTFLEQENMMSDYLSRNIPEEEMGTCVALAFAEVEKRTVRFWVEKTPGKIEIEDSVLQGAAGSEEIDIIHAAARTHYERLRRVPRPELRAGAVPDPRPEPVATPPQQKYAATTMAEQLMQQHIFHQGTAGGASGVANPSQQTGSAVRKTA